MVHTWDVPHAFALVCGPIDKRGGSIGLHSTNNCFVLSLRGPHVLMSSAFWSWKSPLSSVKRDGTVCSQPSYGLHGGLRLVC